MKWPESLALIRHGESAYNEHKQTKKDNPLYQAFKKAFDNRKNDPETARKLAVELVQSGTFTLKHSDHNTPLTKNGEWQAETMAKVLGEKIAVPDVIFVSPYDRTVQTLESMKRGWPALKSVKVVPDHRLREQEHGIALLYNDHSVLYAIHPEQEELRKQQGSYYYRHPQGESALDVQERLRSWISTLIREYAEQKILTVTHHLAILAMRANLERLMPDEFVRIDEEEKPINAGVTIYKGDATQGKDGKLILDTYNAKLY